MSLPLRDRPFIGDALDFHRRDQQHDAAGWVPDVEPCDPDADPSVYEAGEPVDPDLVGDHGINEVW